MSLQNFLKFVRFQIEFLNGISFFRKVLMHLSYPKTHAPIQKYDFDSAVKDSDVRFMPTDGRWR